MKHIPCAHRNYSLPKMCDGVVQREDRGDSKLSQGSEKASLPE